MIGKLFLSFGIGIVILGVIFCIAEFSTRMSDGMKFMIKIGLIVMVVATLLGYAVIYVYEGFTQ
jgi:hypothetical protein